MPYQRTRTPIGRRHERVQIQQRTSSDDGIGGQTASWATLATTWGAIVPLDERNQESLGGDQLTAVHNYHFDLRYRAGARPEPKMRLVWRGKTLEIRTVVDDDVLQRRIIVQASEVQDSNAAA